MSVGSATGPAPAAPGSPSPSPGFWLKFLLKRHLRRHLRAGQLSGELDASQCQAIQFVLDTPEAFDELAASVSDYAAGDGQQAMLAELEATTPPAPTGPQRPIGRFLQWLWNNRQQILQFVLMTVGLFGGPKIPLPVGGMAAEAYGNGTRYISEERSGDCHENCASEVSDAKKMESGQKQAGRRLFITFEISRSQALQLQPEIDVFLRYV